MSRRDVITLIAQSPAAHGVRDQPQETERTVFCTVKSVGMQETYAALASGLKPEKKFVLAHWAEYQGEKKLRHDGEEYRIIRVWQEGQQIELTAGRNSHV